MRLLCAAETFESIKCLIDKYNQYRHTSAQYIETPKSSPLSAQGKHRFQYIQWL